MKKLVLIACAVAGLIIPTQADNTPVGRYQIVQGRTTLTNSLGLPDPKLGEVTLIFKIDTVTGETQMYYERYQKWGAIN